MFLGGKLKREMGKKNFFEPMFRYVQRSASHALISVLIIRAQFSCEMWPEILHQMHTISPVSSEIRFTMCSLFI